MASGQGDAYTVALRAGEVFDRFQLRENTLLGHRHYLGDGSAGQALSRMEREELFRTIGNGAGDGVHISHASDA